ncbi:Hint domain-containing protein [Roseovarius sp. S4756]|uniref:Hint domain-containing protein n=1 Tax=Roseovarius maritimus TaxID=3342637 RepID=UPI0037266B3E
MGTPTIGGDTSGSVLEGSGAIVTGNLDDVGAFTGANDDTWSISSAAGYGTATINPTTGVWSYDLNDSNPVVKALDPGDTLTDVFTVTMLDSDGRTDTQDVTITINGAVCFASGTLIETEDGPRPIEELTPGQMIMTADHGAQPLRWIGSMRYSAAQLQKDETLCPILIEAGALGADCPQEALSVSRQHRMLVRGAAARDAFGSGEALIPAIHLVGLPGIMLDRHRAGVTYYHLLFDIHQIVFGNGAPSESLLLGPQALRTLPARSLAEIAALFPQIHEAGFTAEPARRLARGGRQMRRHVDLLREWNAQPIAGFSLRALRAGRRKTYAA